MTVLLSTTGCMGGMTIQNRVETASTIAESAGLHYQTFKAGRFVVSGWTRITQPNMPIQVYIEGDGLAWLSRSEPSLNPTPKNPLALQLASVDSSPNVIYLARPCQFTKMDVPDNHCSVEDWTSGRFSSDIIMSYNEILNQINNVNQVTSFHLTGYSGGANIAGILATRRHDIISLRTVSGNLDNSRFTQYHQVSPMPSSVNMMDYKDALLSIPQIHYFGEDDTIITPSLAHIFISELSPSACMSTVSVPHVSHVDGWVEQWRILSKNIPTCSQ